MQWQECLEEHGIWSRHGSRRGIGWDGRLGREFSDLLKRERIRRQKYGLFAV